MSFDNLTTGGWVLLAWTSLTGFLFALRVMLLTAALRGGRDAKPAAMLGFTPIVFPLQLMWLLWLLLP